MLMNHNDFFFLTM